VCHLLLEHTDQALDCLIRARAANPRFYRIHLSLAGALGLKGEVNEAKAALTESIRLRPEADSLVRLRVIGGGVGSPQYWALREKTLNVGLRRAGLPDE
jgi:adenylate cyclase